MIPKVKEPRSLPAEKFPQIKPQQAVAIKEAYANKDLTDSSSGQLKYMKKKISETIEEKNNSKSKYQSTVDDTEVPDQRPRKKVRKKFKENVQNLVLKKVHQKVLALLKVHKIVPKRVHFPQKSSQ